MFLNSLSKSLQVIDTVLYLSFLGVGIYFIYDSDIIQKFQLKRTNFAEYEEILTELPTLLTHIQYNFDAKYAWTHLKYGKDFNISFKISGSNRETNSTEGSNSLGGNTLKVNFEIRKEHSKHRDLWTTSNPETRQVNLFLNTKSKALKE